MTFRRFSWEWGGPILSGFAVLAIIGLWVCTVSGVHLSLAGFLVCLLLLAAYGVFAVYVWRLGRLYPRRDDLPEWQEHEAEYEARRALRNCYRNKDR